MAEKVPDGVDCQTKNCTQAADVFCSVCSKLFCEEHIQVHNTLFDDHKLLDTDSYQEQQKILIEQKCTVHDVQLTHCCEQCYTIMCDRCLDEDADSCKNKEGNHSVKTVKNVAEQITRQLLYNLSEVTVREFQMSDDLKLYVNQYEETQNKHRDLLDQVHKINASGMQPETEADSLRDLVIDHMKYLEGNVNSSQNHLDSHSIQLEETRGYVTSSLENQQFLKIIREQKNTQERIQNVQKFNITLQDLTEIQIGDAPTGFTNVHYNVVYTDQRPARKDTPSPIPAITGSLAAVDLAALDINRGTNLTGHLSGKRLKSHFEVWSCLQLESGEIVFGTKGGGLRGITLDEQLHGGKIVSLYENDNKLLILQISRNQQRLSMHEVVLGYNNSVDTDFCEIDDGIYGRFDKYSYHVAANRHHILVTVQYDRCVAFYDKSANHIRDIKHPNISSYPNGIDFLPDGTFVVSDTALNKVSNIRIRGTQLLWTTEITNPTGITVNRAREIILVGSDRDLLHLLSYHGEVLRTMNADLGGLDHIKLSTLDDQEYLLACDGSTEMIIYKFEQEEELRAEHDHLKHMLLWD